MPRKRKKISPQEPQFKPEPHTTQLAQPQQVLEQPPPDNAVGNSPDKRVKQQMPWAETVRSWKSHGSAGVEHVTTTSPDMVGIRFAPRKFRTEEEKREMEAIGLKFISDAQAWLKINKDGAFDETKDLSQRFADRRKQEAAGGVAH